MLAAHRDQENLVHAHQVPAKQNPKTPAPRYPKTPLGRLARNDENAPTAFTGKNPIAGTVKNTINGKLAGKQASQCQVLATPLGRPVPRSLPSCRKLMLRIGNQARAPLGNKTTNAKARLGQSVTGKEDKVKQEPSQLKPSGAKRSKQRQADISGPRFEVQADKTGPILEEEPEYAPPAPIPLPYQSDVLPEGGLTFQSLNKGYLLKGYYENFYNPVDHDGVSRLEKAFDDEMKFALDKAVEQNDREFETLDWSIRDVPESMSSLPTETVPKRAEPKSDGRGSRTVHASDRKLQTISSRRAASALAIHTDKSGPARPSRAPVSRRPLSNSAAQPTVATMAAVNQPFPGATTGEVASRTTIGYSKGRSASSMMRPHQSTSREFSAPVTRLESEDGWDVTVTPGHLRRKHRAHSPGSCSERPQFTSIFYDDEDDTEPVILSGPEIDCDDGETFELKLDI